MSHPHQLCRRLPPLLMLFLLLAACGSSPAAVQTQATASQPPASPAASPGSTGESVATAANPTVAAGATTSPLPASPAASPFPTLPPVTPVPAFPLAAGWWDGAVCYEIFVRSFYDSDGDGIGDFAGLTQKLDYINDGDPASTSDLGANCIWLMPMMPATSYHGYDVTDYYAVNPQLGGNEQFKAFVAAAHQRGIKIVLDLVLNHTSREHPWFQDALNNPNSPYRDWYLWQSEKPRYKSPFGNEAWHKSPVRDEYYYGVFWEGMPDLNYRNPAVTAEAEKISLFWLKEMGADGFRLDAIKHLIERGAAQEDTRETHDWMRQYRSFLEREAPGSFTIGEIFNGNPTTLKDYYPDQNDMYFEFDVAKQTIGAANVATARSYLTAVTNAYDKLPFQRWAPFLSNHDQNRAMSTFNGDMSKAKVAATALLTLPGLPFIYYGEEIGMTGVKPDERIRTPLQWSAASPSGGFSSGTPWEPLQQNYPTINIASQTDDPSSLLNHYRKLIQLHISQPALAQGDFTPLTSSNTSVAAFIRQQGTEAVLVVINFDKVAVTDATLSAPQSGLGAGSYSAAALLGDTPGATLAVGAGGAISGYAPLPELAARSGYVFKLTITSN